MTLHRTPGRGTSLRLKPIDRQALVVTGATSGNGLAIVERAIRSGARVVAVARNDAALDDLRTRLSANGGRIATVVADVSDADAVEQIARTAIAEFGGFDSWINNAGVGVYGSLEQVPIADHRRVFDVNYFGMLHGSLVAARHLRGKGGAIVNIGSILSDRAIVDQGPYCATKHAAQALTDTLRMELEREGTGISVTLVKPGAIDTPFPDHARNFMDRLPRVPPPVYAPDVVADAVLFACAHPRRTIYAGGGGLASALLARAAPRVTDRIMEAVGRKLQQRTEKQDNPERRDNLYEPRADALRGLPNVHVRESSLAVQMQKLPKRAVGMVLVGGAAALAMTIRARARR
ncbi:SDR family NAD(P)-dependent oxidoreductase [Sphingomonas aliaeris]|uniref:SDR family NAD(P)-dependent oxidoreductase n=1 Tax=Sphingomonas aliaeris TaxID=2759526 RepID=A0A974NTJ6_9SPHN|nr:SDR family oxidoreductase [Sphingomonas aliaeris]QQV76679.1 SDR family NAD(P)-dependent oxidoreductase [Sphingomonas aliaeris]